MAAVPQGGLSRLLGGSIDAKSTAWAWALNLKADTLGRVGGRARARPVSRDRSRAFHPVDTLPWLGLFKQCLFGLLLNSEIRSARRCGARSLASMYLRGVSLSRPTIAA